MNYFMIITLGFFSWTALASLQLDIYQGNLSVGYQQIAQEVTSSTSIVLSAKSNSVTSASFKDPTQVVPWLWVRASKVQALLAEKDFDLSEWLKRGGMLIVLQDGAPSTDENYKSPALDALEKSIAKSSLAGGKWRAIPTDHSLLRSFYLLKSLPTCDTQQWREFRRYDRPNILSVPYDLIAGVADGAAPDPCLDQIPRDIMKRLVVNIAMLAMTTHYKSDQIHLPEILKRLR